MAKIDPRIRALIDKVTGKRPRAVIDHILKHGHVSTEDLKNLGYNHPPRAARDVRELGIPLDTFRVQGSDGRSIGAYRFGDPDRIKGHTLDGRQVLPNELRDTLCAENGNRCFICRHRYERRYLQVDHRVPYEIAGNASEPSDTKAFMLLCASCQRSKSWSCENCPNWTTQDPRVCATCYWATPEAHNHVATQQVRRLDIVFADDDVTTHDRLAKQLEREGSSIAEFIRGLLRERGRRDL